MIKLLVEKWIAVTFITVIICVIRMLGRGRIRSCMIYALWGMVVLRLLWPAALALPESPYSIQKWQVSQKISQEISQEISKDDFLRPGQNNVVQSGQNAMTQVGQSEVAQNGQSGAAQNGQNTVSQAGQNLSGQQQESQRLEQSSQGGQVMQEQGQQGNQLGQGASQRFLIFASIPIWLWIWVSGTTLFGIVMAVSQLRFLRRLKRERVLWNSADRLTDLVDTPIPVYLWEGSTSPFLYGVFHPAIYVPKALTREEQTLEYALLHEWCHYRHGDHIWALTRVICLALYWHHPLVWVAASLSRSDCELACDDSVRVCLGEKQRLDYAGSLLSILEEEVQREDFGYMTTSMRGDGREIARRMKLLWDKRPGRVLSIAVACVALLGMGCAAFTATAPTGQEEKGTVAAEELPKESADDMDSVLTEGPGSLSDPISAEIGQELYEGIYYSAEIDKREGVDVFCYLGAQHGNPQFEINGTEMISASVAVDSPVCEVIDGATREVYYLVDLREDDAYKELAVTTENKNGTLQTVFYKYEGTWISTIGIVNGVLKDLAEYVTAGEEKAMIHELSKKVQWYDQLTVDGSGELHGWKRSDLTALYYLECHWQLAVSGDSLTEVVPADGWYIYGGEGAVDDSVPYLHGDLMLYAQPDMTSERLLLQTKEEYGYEQVMKQTLRLLQTDNAHWFQVEAWNGITGWLYMETPGILRIDGELYSWDNFVTGPVVTQDSLISTVHKERTRDEEEAWMETLLQTEAISVEIGEDGIQLLADVLYQADLNEDGTKEKFCYLGADSETQGPHFVINGKKYYVGQGYEPVITSPTGIYVKYWGLHGERQETYYLCNILIGDGQTEFGLGHWDEGRKTSFLAYDGRHMKHIGTVDNIPFASADQYAFGVRSRELEQKNLANGTWGFDGAGRIGLSIPINLLQTWSGNVVWELDENSNQLQLLPQKDGFYEISDPWYYKDEPLSEDGFAHYPHLVQDLVVYTEPDLQSRTLVFSAEDHGPDNKIYFTHTDNEHWIRIVDDAGMAGWFYMESFDLVRTKEGLVPALDIFGYLYQVG